MLINVNYLFAIHVFVILRGIQILQPTRQRQNLN